MRMLMTVKMPTNDFNTTLRSGNATKLMNRILEECRPEAVYFTSEEGQRTALVVLDVNDPSEIPRLAEPWFLSFNASVDFKIAMTPDDIKKSALDDLGRKWG